MGVVSTKSGALVLLAMLAVPGSVYAQPAPAEGEAMATVYGTPPADLSGMPEGPEIEGFISARSAEKMQVTRSDGTGSVVLISDGTEIKARKGLFGLGSSKLAADSLLNGLPVTVKTRIGVDEHDDYAVLRGLTERIVAAGVAGLFVHARKAWLKGLSPKQNREIPPLDYPRVHRLKAEFAELPIAINGGFASERQVEQQIGKVDGVMLGRAAYQDPMLIGRLDRLLFGTDSSYFPRGWQRSIFEQQQKALASAGATADDRSLILGGNFDRLFPQRQTR